MNCKICREPIKLIIHPHLSFNVPSDYPLSGEMKLGFCRKCEFLFNVSPSVESDYNHYYTHFNKHHVRANDAVHRDAQYFKELIRFLESSTGKTVAGSRILDYGAGTREFSRIAIEAGAADADNVDVGFDHFSLDYDWIVSTHCFEHLVDPVANLRSLVERLRDGGRVCLAMPDMNRYREAYYGPWAHFDLEHINHFSLRSASQLLESCDLRLVSHRCIDRLVGANLAYSEVLVVGERVSGDLSQFAALNLGQEQVLEEMIVTYEKDVEIVLEAIDAILETACESHDRHELRFGFYGLSTYGLRMIEILKSARPDISIDFLADSDYRLTGMLLQDVSIMDWQEFELYVQNEADRGATVITVIAAINGYRIAEMFEGSVPPLPTQVFLLPPNTQNR